MQGVKQKRNSKVRRRRRPLQRDDWRSSARCRMAVGILPQRLHLVGMPVPVPLSSRPPTSRGVSHRPLQLRYRTPIAARRPSSRPSCSTNRVGQRASWVGCRPASSQDTPLRRSWWGCVETKSHGTKVPCPSRAYEFTQKNVTWKDSLFPRQHSTSSPSPSTAK
jgi:hypothetical protein